MIKPAQVSDADNINIENNDNNQNNEGDKVLDEQKQEQLIQE